jgi:hypothetical protein
MDYDLNFLENGRRIQSLENGRQSQYCGKWKTTSIFFQIEDDLNSLENGRRPQLFWKWKTTSIIWKMEDDLNLKVLEDDPTFLTNGM